MKATICQLLDGFQPYHQSIILTIHILLLLMNYYSIFIIIYPLKFPPITMVVVVLFLSIFLFKWCGSSCVLLLLEIPIL